MRAASGSPSPRGVHAGGDDDGAGLDGRAVVELDARDAVVLDAHGDRAGAAHVGDLAQRGDEPARVDRVVARDVEREPHGRRERGLGAAGLARAQALDGQAERLAEGDQALQRLGLVGVARDHERAAAAQGRVDPGARQLGAERLEPPRAAQAELEQRALAELRLGDGREHAGGDVPGAGLAVVEHDRGQAAARRRARRTRGRSVRRR